MFLESLYLKIFVNIVVNKYNTSVYIESCSKKETVDTAEETFKTTTINDEMYEFINSFTKESPFHYISILDTSSSQGLIPSCKNDRVLKTIDKSSSKYLCFNQSWAYYTSKLDLKETQHEYSRVGVDFIFSPFILLNRFFQDKIDSHMAMFILIEGNYISLSVFDNSTLLYGVHLDMQNDIESEELLIDEDMEADINLDSDDGIDLDDIDALEEMDGLDDFGDIEDLDSIDDIDEFSETRDVEEELTEEAEAVEDNMPIDDSDGFTDDYHRYSMIQTAVNEFYKDERYDSKFIETVYIADGVGVSPDLKTYLEDEMFLSVYIRHLDLPSELCELAKLEAK